MVSIEFKCISFYLLSWFLVHLISPLVLMNDGNFVKAVKETERNEDVRHPPETK